MLHFPKDYFLGEYRSDYYVKPIDKHRWAAMLEIVAKVDRVCRKYGITYFADWGTLLGAVRHQGFIPWDDDVDLAMRREDFERFLQIAPLEFDHFEERPEASDRGNRLFYHSLGTAKKAFAQQVIIANSRHISFEEDFLAKYHGCPFAEAIDIFPLDYFPEDSPETDAIRQIMELFCDIVDHSGHWNADGSPSEQTVYDQLQQAGELIGYTAFDGDKSLRLQAAQLFNRICAAYDREESAYLEHAYWETHIRNRSRRFPIEWYDECIYIPFENIQIPVPAEYDRVLTLMYGDYMTPVQFGSHTNAQLESLRAGGAFGDRDVEEALVELAGRYI